MAAIGKVGREAIELLDCLASNGVLTKTFKRRCLRALDSPRTTVRLIPTDAALARLKAQPAPMTAQQEKDVIETLATCGIVLRQVSSISADCKLYADFARDDIEAKLR